jgi:hypothetical protein
MIDILKSFILPSNICFLLIAAGLVLLVPRRTRRPASIALVTAGLLLVIFSSGKTPSWLMSLLEYAYPVSSERVAGARAAVILAAYGQRPRHVAQRSPEQLGPLSGRRRRVAGKAVAGVPSGRDGHLADHRHHGRGISGPGGTSIAGGCG